MSGDESPRCLSTACFVLTPMTIAFGQVPVQAGRATQAADRPKAPFYSVFLQPRSFLVAVPSIGNCQRSAWVYVPGKWCRLSMAIPSWPSPRAGCAEWPHFFLKEPLTLKIPAIGPVLIIAASSSSKSPSPAADFSGDRVEIPTGRSPSSEAAPTRQIQFSPWCANAAKLWNWNNVRDWNFRSAALPSASDAKRNPGKSIRPSPGAAQKLLSECARALTRNLGFFRMQKHGPLQGPPQRSWRECARLPNV